MLIDTHCHLDSPLLFDCLPALLERAAEAGVDRFLVPGVSFESWGRIAALAELYPSIYPAFGLHPLHAGYWTRSIAYELEYHLPTALAVGEIGLDYSIKEPSRGAQQFVFREQLMLARVAGLPVLIHCRKAFADLLRILREERVEQLGGVMHAFSGSPEVARECIGLGLGIGVAGPVTWSSAVRPVALVREIPLEHLLLETDSPDLAPEPYRGRANEPAFLVNIAQKVADVKGVTLEAVGKATTQNAERILNVRTTPFFPH